MQFIWCLVLVLIFSTEARAGLFDNVISQVQQTVNTAEKQAGQQQAGQQQTAQQQNQTGQQQEATSVNIAYADLDKGVFGIPFKTGVQDVLKWCLENNVTTKNPTKQQAEQNFRNIVDKIQELSDAYNKDKSDLSEVQKVIAKEVDDPTVDVMKKMVMVQAQKSLDILKNPSVDYQGNTYFLESLFPDGFKVNVSGTDKMCTDTRITRTMYSLTVVPSDQSEKLKNNSVDNIKIYFKLDTSNNLISYATLATFQGVNENDVIKERDMLNEVLNDKYGSPTVHAERIPPMPPKEIYSLAGIDLQDFAGTGREFSLWRENIMLFPERIQDERPMVIFYYEPNEAKGIWASFDNAVKDFENMAAKKDADKETQAKQDF